MKDHSMIFHFLKGFINWISMKRYHWCRGEWHRRTAIFKRHILSSFQQTTQRLTYLYIGNVNYVLYNIIHIFYEVSVIQKQYLQCLLSVEYIYYLILERTLMKDRDGGSRAHYLYSSILMFLPSRFSNNFSIW